MDIQAEFPTKPDILIVNNFKRNLDDICDELIMKIKKTLKK